MLFSPTCSHSTQLFPQNLNSNGKWTCQDRRNRIAADIESNEAFPGRETNPTDFDKLEGCNPNRPRICSPKQPGQIDARPISGDRYIICSKPPYPAEKILDRRQLDLVFKLDQNVGVQYHQEDKGNVEKHDSNC